MDSRCSRPKRSSLYWKSHSDHTGTKMGLYQFQTDAVTRCIESTARRILLVSPTGTGKTVMMMELARHFSQTSPGVVLVHRIELRDQTANRFAAGGLSCGIFPDVSKPITIAMVQTVRRRLKTLEDKWAWAFMDEAHRDEFSIAHQSQNMRLFGFSATPRRSNGAAMSQWFDVMVEATNYSDAISGNFIVPARVWAPDIPNMSGIKTRGGDYDQVELAKRIADNVSLVGSVAKFWVENSRKEKTIVFAVDVSHAKMLAAEFKDRGVEALVVTGETPESERAAIMSRFRVGSLRVLVNVAVYVEGLDVGDASIIVLARPTKSLVLYLQMVGRACRTATGKSHYRVFDHSGNRFMHGHPSVDRAWSISEARDTKAKSAPAPDAVRYCKRCFYVFGTSQTACPQCATPNTTPPVRHKDGTLVEVPPDKYDFLPGLVDNLHAARKRAFAEAFARHIPRSQMWGFVQKRIAETVAIQRGAHQVIVPQNHLLLW